MYKTRLTQKNKAKHTSNAKQKKKQKKKKKNEREREKAMESLGALSLPHLGRTFPFNKPLI